MDQPPVGLESGFPDIGELPARDLAALDESVLATALRRIWHEADHPDEVLAGWSSNIA